MEPWLKAFILAAIFGATLILVERLGSAIARSRSTGNAINKRLQMIDKGVSREETMIALRRGDDAGAYRMSGVFGDINNGLRTMLVQAGVTGSAGRIAFLLMLLPVAIFLLLLAVFALGGYAMNVGRIMLLITAALGLGAAVPFLALRFMANRRRRKMEMQFPVALDVFVRGLRAGHPVASALELLTVEMPDPVGSEFGLVVDEVTYGADLRDALEEMAERWDLDDIRMFVVSLSVQQETGGTLTHDGLDAFAAAADDLPDRLFRQGGLLPRCRGRPDLRAGLRHPDPDVVDRHLHDPQTGRFEGLSA